MKPILKLTYEELVKILVAANLLQVGPCEEVVVVAEADELTFKVE